MFVPCTILGHAAGGTVGWGTALQAERSRVRFPMGSLLILTCICLMAGVPTEMTFNTTSTVKLCQSIIVMTSQRDNTLRHDNALPVTCHSRCASHRTMHMSYRCKTYTWNDVILVNPLNAELNPICYLVALLGAHHFLHISRIRVTSLTLRQLMPYIYI